MVFRRVLQFVECVKKFGNPRADARAGKIIEHHLDLCDRVSLRRHRRLRTDGQADPSLERFVDIPLNGA